MFTLAHETYRLPGEAGVDGLVGGTRRGGEEQEAVSVNEWVCG